MVSVCTIQCDESALSGVDSPFGRGSLGMDHLSHNQGEQTHEDDIVKIVLYNIWTLTNYIPIFHAYS